MSNRIRPDYRRFTLLAVITAAALLLRVWGLPWGLHDANVSRRAHPDEWAIYWLFHWFSTGGNLDPCPTPGASCFFDWGTVYPYLAYAIHGALVPVSAFTPLHVFGRQADATFVWAAIAGRLTSAILSTATVVVVYRLANETFGTPVGLPAAAVTAVSCLLAQLAHFATPDSTTVFFMSCTLLACAIALNRPSSWRFVVTGALLGLSVGTEYHMALLIVPIALAWTLGGVRRPRDLVLMLGCAALTYCLSNAYALVHPRAFLAAIEHTVNMRTVDSQAQYQGRWSAYGPEWLYVVRYPLGYGVGVALTVWMMAGLTWSLYRHAKGDALLLSWVLVYFLLVTVTPAKFMRYSAPLVPVLAILSARLAVDLFRIRRVALKTFLAAAMVASMAFTTAYDGAYASLFSGVDSRLAAAQWLAHRAAGSTSVGFEQLPNGLLNMPEYVSADGYRVCFAQFQSGRVPDLGRYVVLDSYALEEHPQVASSAVRRFRSALTSDKNYRLVLSIHTVPSLFGMRFPIDGSPHDWRYPVHQITVYEARSISARNPRYCFPDLDAARVALYRAPPGD